jgi:putative transcriptional regulator
MLPINLRDDQMMIGKRVKLARVEKDLSQAHLAEKVGCTRQTIGLIEADRFNPSLKLCLAIAKALNKTLDELFWIEVE